MSIMKVNTKTVLLDFAGSPIVLDGVPMTFRDAAANALNVLENPATAEEKNICYQIGKKLFSANEVNFTTDECAKIKEKVSNIYTPVVTGRVTDILDGVEEPKKPTATE